MPVALRQNKCNRHGGTAYPPYQNIGIADFKAKMSKADIMLLYVCTPEEIAKGKIEGVMELNFHKENLATEVGKLDENKTCLICRRSRNCNGKMCRLMPEQGFTKLYNLEGRYTAWSQ